MCVIKWPVLQANHIKTNKLYILTEIGWIIMYFYYRKWTLPVFLVRCTYSNTNVVNLELLNEKNIQNNYNIPANILTNEWLWVILKLLKWRKSLILRDFLRQWIWLLVWVMCLYYFILDTKPLVERILNLYIDFRSNLILYLLIHI